MSFSTSMAAVIVAACLATSAAADDAAIRIADAYARAASPLAKAGAAFLTIENTGATDDVLIAADTPAAQRVELHTHVDAGNGVMRMTKIDGGLPLPAGASATLRRGGDHVMLMGLTAPLEQGESIALTLTFQQAGKMTVEVPVDNERQPVHGAAHH